MSTPSSRTESDALDRAAEVLRKSPYNAVLTGAGVSVESGLPDFRSADGLWTRYDPLVYAHIGGFHRHPERIWTFVKELIVSFEDAAPNDGHRALAALEEAGRLHAVVTQNIDNLHQAAGSRRVIEFHGNAYGLVCLRCGARDRVRRPDGSLVPMPPRCACGAVFKPDFIFFGESIPPRALNDAVEAAVRCRVMIVAGTSAEVAPASLLPYEAKRAGACIVEMNLEQTSLTCDLSDIFVPGPFGRTMPELARRVLAPA